MRGPVSMGYSFELSKGLSKVLSASKVIIKKLLRVVGPF